MTHRLVLLCGLLAAVGCGPRGPAQTVENYFPLAVGNQWIYTAAGDTTDNDTRTITGVSTDADSIRWYEWGYGEDADYTAHIDGKVVFSDVPDETLGVVMLKEPLEVGASWRYSPLDTSSLSRIEDTRASASTHAGEFENCIKVWSQFEDEEFVCWYAPGVGLLKVAVPGEDDVELYDYDLK